MISSTHLNQLVHALPARYTTPLPHLARVRLLTGAHLDRLLAEPEAAPATISRVRRRIMNRLINLGLVATLERTIGGVRTGSAGHLYTLTQPDIARWPSCKASRAHPERDRHRHLAHYFSATRWRSATSTSS